MRAVSVDEPDIANGAGIRRDGRGTDRSTTCFFEGIPRVANGRRATTSAQVTFFFGADFLCLTHAESTACVREAMC